MKPRAFRYRLASSLDEVYGLLGDPDEVPRIIAGGQSLVPMMNLRVVMATLLIDIGGLDELRQISCRDGVLRIGALARHCQVETDTLVARHAPLLRQAVRHVAHQVIRNRGTFGGSLCHADPAAEMPACALLLDATMELGSARGTREVGADEFFEAPLTTAVQPDELLLAARLPAAPPGTVFAFHELSRRQGDFAIAGVAARASTGAAGRETRWVGFGIGGRPIRLQAVQALFSNTFPGDVADARIAEAVEADMPVEDANHDERKLKIVLTAEMVRRCADDLRAAMDIGND